MATTLGIDIGKHSIRGALLKTGLRTVEIERYLEVPVDAVQGDLPDASRAHAAVRQLISELSTPPDNVVIALDGSRASLRAVSIPLAARKRAQDVLPFELESLLPFPIDEALIDYQEIGQQGTELSLMAVAVPETVVASTLESLTSVGVSPRELAVGAASLDGLLAFLTPGPDEVTMLLYMDLEQSEACVVRNGACELARTLDEGIETLRARPVAMRNALHHTVLKYRADGGPQITKLLVMGPAAVDPIMVGFIGQAVGLEAEAVSLPSPKDAADAASPLFGKALALAGRTVRRGKRIDMRKGKYALPRGVSQLREYALLATLCASALVLSYSFRVWAEYRVLAEERDALQEKLSKVTEEHFGQATTSPKRARELLEGGGEIKQPLPRFDAFRALAAISGAVPSGIKHDTRKVEIGLDENKLGKFELQGQIPDLAARDQVADALEANPCFEALERGRTSTVPGEDRKNYTLEGVIACPGTAKPKKKKSASAD